MARGGVIQWQSGAMPRTRALLWVLIAITVGVIGAVSVKLWSLSHSTDRPTDRAARTSSTAEPSTGEASLEATEADGFGEAQPGRGADENSYRFATELYQNDAAGYSFRYPGQWSLERQGTASRLTSPDEHVVITFGLGPQGGLPVAYDEFVALLGKTYKGLVVSDVKATRVNESVGVVLRGSATGGGGVPVRFIATILERPGERRAIGALAATDLASASFPAAVGEILTSFRPI
jgi:hypothetical protein